MEELLSFVKSIGIKEIHPYMDGTDLFTGQAYCTGFCLFSFIKEKARPSYYKR